MNIQRKPFSHRRYVACAVLPAFVLLSAADRAVQQSLPTSPQVACKNLDSAAQRMTDEAVKYMRSNGNQSLIVGPFLGPPRGLGGARLTQAIKGRLPKEIKSQPGPGALALIGRYKLRKNNDSQVSSASGSSVVIETTLTDALGEPLLNLTTCVLSDAASIQSLMATRAGGVKSK